jgi:O-antigen ligase
MTLSATSGETFGRHQPVAVAGPAMLWVVFLFGVSSAVRSILPGVHNPERYFWLPADLVVTLWVLLRPEQAARMMRENAILMLWAGVACLSALWSLTPDVSLYHGIQLLMTILVGFLLCANWHGVRILQFLFIALLAVQLLSLAVVALNPAWGISPWGEWRGAFTHKNELGNMMALQILTALVLFLHGWRPRLAGSALLLAAGLIVMSRSGTGLVALLFALSVLPLALCYLRGSGLFSFAAGAALLMAACAMLIFSVGGVSPMDLMLSKLGKDETLTGRTVLWDFGLAAFKDRPWLGHGFKGYWESPLTTALQLREVMGQDLWFFHNMFIEVSVAFGVLGPMLLIAGLAIALSRSMSAFVREPRALCLWPLLFLLYLLPYVLAENPLFQNHSLLQLLFVAAMCARFRRLPDAELATPRSSQP